MDELMGGWVDFIVFRALGIGMYTLLLMNEMNKCYGICIAISVVRKSYIDLIEPLHFKSF